MIDRIKEKIFSSALFKLAGKSAEGGAFSVTGLSGSLVSFLTEFLREKTGGKVVFISDSTDRLFRLRGDLGLLSRSDNISVFSSDKKTETEDFTRSLNSLSSGSDFAVLVSAGDLKKKILPDDVYRNALIKLRKNDEYLFEELTQKLGEYRYEKKDFVEETGDYSVRGGIVDVFPEHCDAPVRIEFFGETVESIREFDITSQRSLKELAEISVGINLSGYDEAGQEPPDAAAVITDYFPNGVTVIIDEPDSLGVESRELLKGGFRCIELFSFRPSDSSAVPLADFGSGSQPDFHSNIKMLVMNIASHLGDGREVYILCSDGHQAGRMKTLAEDFEEELTAEDDRFPKVSDKILIHNESLQDGFIFPDAGIAVYTEHQIFGRYFRQPSKRRRKFRGLTFDEIKELKQGDYVVHRDFGIGMFAGLKKIRTGSGMQEVVKISYAGGDTVFLNLNYVNLINKYSAGEGISPKITRLGGGEWDRIKEKAKKKVKDIARDLILLYAMRKSQEGISFSPDSHWQRELEAGFIYEDTPDQITATEDVKRDMESPSPMDRLICGDVGFGKTEIAVRAAFKAVLDNRQAAVLVPTTILAIQHYNTFRDRLSPFAVETAVISRLTPKNEQTEILRRTEEGKVNILIGTHRILSKDIRFKDLGLLVIDEEQRFGVKAKEKLRALKPNVDTLTLTATPIPRTLNFSLLGARDLSVINTPPKNRKPIITEIIHFDWSIITDVIRKEIDRGGQVYFVNDKISNLYDFADKFREFLPYAKAGVAHGQMPSGELEDVIIDFIEKKLNVLFCTKIIESGLDIPNVNTIIINNANMYGLAELYQLRGRVGRSDVQAYAYFISPPAGRLTRTAVRRLQAIEEYTELGSGFNLSMRDMEIRGVGNLLGKQQSGFVNQMGFEMFIDVIDEAVAELKENEFSELFREEESLRKLGDKIKKKTEESAAVIENDFNALIPDDYIENDVERLNVYKRLYDVRTREQLAAVAGELSDRFGRFSTEVDNLIRVIDLKIRAAETGIEKISVNGNEMQIYFPVDKNHFIFQGEFFRKMIERLSASKGGKYSFVNNDDRLIIQVLLDSSDDRGRITEIKELLLHAFV